jgi:thiamine-monophosphate kinase
MNELALIERIAKLAGKPRSEVLVGIGDDCAIYRPKSGEDLLFTTDQMIEGVHFFPNAKPRTIGERALARSLSDIAAMGASPRFCLVTLALPANRTGPWATSFFRGLLALAARAGTTLAGGDVAHNDTIHIDVMVCGAAPKGKALRRDGARSGDKIYVSGRLGRPWETKINPRLSLGQSLLGRATACMDLSDGLSIDLHRMCLASKLAARLDSVPLYKGASLERALHGGEDYELLFTLPKKLKPPRGCFEIGEMIKDVPGRLEMAGRKIRPEGYSHFQ